MNKIVTLAGRRPLAFALLALVAWFALGALLVLASAALLGVSILENGPQTVGTLGATLILLAAAWRLGWLRAIGVGRVGDWTVWLLAVALLVYLLVAYWLGFFGDLTSDPAVWFRLGEGWAILGRQAVVGFVEETLFRGIILYVLARVWGRTARGLLAAVLVQAALFGAVHMLQAGTVNSWSEALMVVVNSFVSGTWWGATVLLWGTVWPAALLHGASNAAVQLKGLTSLFVQPSVAAYGRATALELPLMALALWFLWRWYRRSAVPISRTAVEPIVVRTDDDHER
jgi:membrane protease YdiL (CAAX protease family)